MINEHFNDTIPPSIDELLVFRDSSYNLRGDNVLTLSIVKSTKYCLKSLRYFAPKQWNSLSNYMCVLAETKQFLSLILAYEFNSNNF